MSETREVDSVQRHDVEDKLLSFILRSKARTVKYSKTDNEP